MTTTPDQMTPDQMTPDQMAPDQMAAYLNAPYAKVNARRDELLTLNAEKTRVVTKRIADLRGQVLTVRADADKFARAYHLQKANELRADAANIDAIIRTLTTVELPKLQIEAENIRQNRHPELAALMTAANIRQQNAATDHRQQLFDAITSAKGALYDHLGKLGTAETLRLAQAVFDAERAADCEPSEAARALTVLLPKCSEAKATAAAEAEAAEAQRKADLAELERLRAEAADRAAAEAAASAAGNTKGKRTPKAVGL
jgi:hypothetical protein